MKMDIIISRKHRKHNLILCHSREACHSRGHIVPRGNLFNVWPKVSVGSTVFTLCLQRLAGVSADTAARKAGNSLWVCSSSVDSIGKTKFTLCPRRHGGPQSGLQFVGLFFNSDLSVEHIHNLCHRRLGGGCGGGARTPDPVVNSHLLYQLSYTTKH